MGSNSLLLFFESGINVALDLVLDSFLTASSNSFIFNILLNTPAFKLALLVHGFVDQQLVRMIVQTSQLDFSVGLVGKSSLRIEFAQLDWSLAPQWESECVSERNQECLLDLSVSVEVLSEVSGQVSVGLMNFVKVDLPLKKE